MVSTMGRFGQSIPTPTIPNLNFLGSKLKPAFEFVLCVHGIPHLLRKHWLKAELMAISSKKQCFSRE